MSSFDLAPRLPRLFDGARELAQFFGTEIVDNAISHYPGHLGRIVDSIQ